MTIRDLSDAYLAWAAEYYTQGGRPTRTAANIASVLNILNQIAGSLPVTHLQPVLLRDYRAHLKARGTHTRRSINDAVAWVRRMADWAADREIISDDVPARMLRVQPIKLGRENVAEGPGVLPVSWEAVTATLAHADLQLSAMIEIHWRTGMRPGELVAMRRSWMDLTGDLPVYEPHLHKTAWRGQKRFIPLGPNAAMVFAQWERRRRAGEDRLWSITTTGGYRSAVVRVQSRHGLPRWTPGQIRHATATLLRASEGIEAARVALGHRAAATTQIYAAEDRARAIDIARRYG